MIDQICVPCIIKLESQTILKDLVIYDCPEKFRTITPSYLENSSKSRSPSLDSILAELFAGLWDTININ